MKATLEFTLPEDETELQAAVNAMDQLGAIHDFQERLRSLKKYGHDFETADAAVEAIYADYCETMGDYL